MEEDRISQLPECIVHHILSFLNSPTHLVRISVLSKTWLALTASFPILDFNFSKISRALRLWVTPFDTLEERRHAMEKFFEYVAHTMSRFCEQNVSAHTFKLIAELQEPTDVDVFDRWIELIVEKGVQVLVLDMYTWPPLEEYRDAKPLLMYRLPNTLLSASSLISLTIRCCAIPPSLMVDRVKFRSLKLLSLDSIPMDEEVINYLTTSCPLLEEFNVDHCYGFKRFCVYGLQNLQKVMICYVRVERIDIEAPNLNYICLKVLNGRRAPCINLASCKKLKTLSFHGDFSSTSKGFVESLSNFPLIENLFLNIPTQCNNLKVSSHSLRKFVLHPRCDLEGIEIDAPSLLLFEYSGDSHPVPFPLARTSVVLQACMECCPTHDVDILWFQKLRRFLDKKNGFKVLKMNISADFIDVDELKVIRSPPFELEHVELKLDAMLELSVCVAVVDAVFWCCCPQSLNLRSSFPYFDFEVSSHVVKLTYEKLLQQEDQGQTNIQTVLSSASKAKKHFINLNSLLKALPRDRQEQVFTFIKGGEDNETVVCEYGDCMMHWIMESNVEDGSTNSAEC